MSIYQRGGTTASVLRTLTKCDTCGRDPAKVFGLHSECSHTACPNRRPSPPDTPSGMLALGSGRYTSYDPTKERE